MKTVQEHSLLWHVTTLVRNLGLIAMFCVIGVHVTYFVLGISPWSAPHFLSSVLRAGVFFTGIGWLMRPDEKIGNKPKS